MSAVDVRPRYRGRFAPSPTGPLHAGSLVAALASWLDARAHDGEWLIRIEDVDLPRCPTGMAERVLDQLARCGLTSDQPPLWQSQRTAHYQAALTQLQAQRKAYPCGCSRTDIAQALAAVGSVKSRHGELIYPGTCRTGLHGKEARAWRFSAPAVADQQITAWCDRQLGPQQQDVAQAVGDFVLLRADGYFSYQLAVVVDDALQGITDIVRGADLSDNTARQILLQHALAYPKPRYLHTPLVCAPNGEKLSKQNGAAALQLDDEGSVLAELSQAAAALGLQAPESGDNRGFALARWQKEWREKWLHRSR